MEPRSTLEVDYDWEANTKYMIKYQARVNYSESPEALPAEQLGLDQPQKVEAANEDDAPEVFAVHQNDSAIHEQEDTYKAADGGFNGKVSEWSICGVKRRTFFIILAVAAIVIIGAIVGAVAGVVVSRKNGSSSASPSDGTNTSTNLYIMDISSLSATNWTDPSGFKHKTVFFQDPYNSIIAQRWDSQNRTWETTNITKVMAASPTPLNTARGTSIASASLEWLGAYATQLWFLDSNNIIQLLYNDILDSPGLWKNKTMSNAQIVTYPGSKIAATWQRCKKAGCVGNWVVAYQGPSDGAVETVNQTNYLVATDVIRGSGVTGNTTLAIVPQYMGNQDSLGLISQNYGSGTTGSMQLSTYNNSASSWRMNNTDVITNVPLPASTQHSAIAKWNTWASTLCLALFNDGTVKGSWWDDKTHTSLPSIIFDGGPAVNFSAIAMTVDAMLYGISNDTILEYSVDTADPSIFHYVGQVYP